MAFGILEDRKLATVPGTGLLSARGSQVTTDDVVGLKRGTGRSSHIVLIPQPSDDPNDPLNWPTWRKEACFWTLVLMAFFVNAVSPLASPAYIQLAKEFRVSVDQVASSFSTAYLGSAIALLLQNPFAIKYGHRIVYLLATFLMFISCVWCALSTDLASISASRIFQGFGVAPVQSLIAVTISHLYFVHERGTRTSIFSLLEVSGSILGPFVNSYVVQDLSWRLGFWFMSIACGISFIAVALFVPETTYHRQPSLRHDSAAITGNVDHRADALPSSRPSFLSQLKIYNGTFSEESMWNIFLRPFCFLVSPVMWFMFLSNVIPSAFVGVVGVCASAIFTVTYGFNTAQIGLTQLGGLIGSILGIFVAGPLGDWWIVWASRCNRGIYEPEFRLVLILSLLVGTFSYIGWAIGNDNHMPWIGAVVCLALLYFGALINGSSLTVYAVDTHGANSIHIVSLGNLARSIVIYASAFFVNGIVLSAGVKATLLFCGAFQAICWLACIPMYAYGKRCRSFIARHPRLFNRDLLGSDLPPSRSSSGTDSKH